MTKDPYIIINPSANTGRLGKNLDKALKLVEQYIGKFEYSLTESPRHEKELAQKAIDEGYKFLVALGGDGTATNMGDVIINHPDVKLGLISAGSMCDWHQSYYIPFHMEESLKILKEGHVEKIPAMRCKGDEETYSFDMTDGGFTGKAAAAAHYEMKWMKIGSIKYDLLAVKYVIKTKNTPCMIKIDDNEPFKIDALTNFFVALSDDISGFHVLPGNTVFCKKNKDLGIAIVHGKKGLSRISMLVKAIPGNHIGIKGVWFSRGKKIEIESLRDPLCCEAEGEIYNEHGMKIEIERVDDAISLIVPKEREYKIEYDESYFHEKFEDSFKKRKFERVPEFTK